MPHRATRALLLGLCLLTALLACVGVPLRLPEIGLDPSWEQALVEATDQGRIFGKDLVFSYGPLHQAATQQVSANPVPLLSGRILLGLAWSAACALVGIWRGIPTAFLFTMLVGLLNSRNVWVAGKADVLFITLAICGILLSVGQLYPSTGKGRLRTALLVLVAIGIGLAPLVKLSFLGLAVPAITVMAALSGLATAPHPGQRSAPWPAVLMTLAPMLALIATWSAIGAGSVAQLWHYFSGPNLSVVMGYTEAMALVPQHAHASSELLLYGLCAVLAGKVCWGTVLMPASIQLAGSPGKRALARWIPAIGLVVIGWIVFKASFVRHDIHAITAGLSLVSFSALVGLLGWPHTAETAGKEGWTRTRFTVLVMSALLGGGMIARNQGWHPVDDLSNQARLGKIPATLRLLFTPGGQERMEDLRQERLTLLRNYTEDYRIQEPSQLSADVLPWDVSDLLSQGLIYQPRPVPQSYSAYQQPLQNLNAQFFRAGPEVVVVAAKEIDGRLPIGVDGAAVQQILARYRFSHQGSQGSLVFRRCPEEDLPVCGRPVVRSRSTSGTLRWHHEAVLGFVSSPIRLESMSQTAEAWLSLDLSPSPLRKFFGVLFKAPPLILDYLNENGAIMAWFRILPSASQHLLVVPLVRTNHDLFTLSTGARIVALQQKPGHRIAKQATFLRLRTPALSQPFTNSGYKVEIVERRKPTQASQP